MEHRDIFPLYFQHVALVFTQHFLDRWSRDRQNDSSTLLDELNAFRTDFNMRFTDRSAVTDQVDECTQQDLAKLAFSGSQRAVARP